MTEQTQTTDNIEQLKAEFQKKKADYLAKESKLKGLESEKAKAEEMKAALENELQEIADKTQTAIDADKFLTADQYAEMKSADFNLKAKIDYYQAVIEEVEDKLYKFKTELHYERSNILNLRVGLFREIIHTLIEDFKRSHGAELSKIFAIYAKSGLTNINSYSPKDPIIQELDNFMDIVREFINISAPIDENFTVKNLIYDFKAPSIIKLHHDKTLEEMGILTPEPRGFKKLINDLTK
ncbi:MULTISPECIES: hypothetical protein [unclassified Lonepinella]|uniref:hypothetical protein n=1 Tax=unclassified Lonepinella TaxID=2642006 RepID=UPI0036D859E3